MQKISCSLRFLFLLILPASAFAQLLPVSAHAVLYFPHFADGGSPAQQWQTTFTFVNPSSSPVDAQLNLLDNDGQPLALDLGSGLTGALNFTVPANGLQIFRSRIASPSIVTGWAFAIATYPLDATVAFRAIANGKAQTEVTAEPTLPTPIYIAAEYDPYASAGTLSKLAMATGTAGLTTQFEQQLSGDAHQSFNTRLASIFNTISLACSDPAVTATCNQYKSLIHPHLPSTAPLLRKEPSEPR